MSVGGKQKAALTFSAMHFNMCVSVCACVVVVVAVVVRAGRLRVYLMKLHSTIIDIKHTSDSQWA